MPALSPTFKQMELDVVGSTMFGRYQKINASETFNMIISDNWLVPFAGYERAGRDGIPEQFGTVGRGLFTSTIINKMFGIFDNKVFMFDTDLSYSVIGNLDTYNGDVFIADGSTQQLGICDKKDIYMYGYGTNNPGFNIATTTDFTPGYLDFQDSRFMTVDIDSNNWRLSTEGNGLVWPNTGTQPYAAPFQTTGDNPLVTIRVHGQGNLAMVMGSQVTEMWTDTGQQLFPYQKNTYINLDYGTVNASTVATNETIVVWVGQNRQSSPSILVSNGNEPHKISTDGIDYRLSQLQFPTSCYAFLFRQDGHLLYIVTFWQDNVTYAYDFETKKFFTLTDENGNYFPAKRVVRFNNKNYFISINDGYLYELSTQIGTYLGNDIPRIRTCSTLRIPGNGQFRVNNVTLVTEMGQYNSPTQPKALDMRFSKSGGVNFSNDYRVWLNEQALFQNQVKIWPRVICNEFTAQFRFYGDGRFVNGPATVSIEL